MQGRKEDRHTSSLACADSLLQGSGGYTLPALDALIHYSGAAFVSGQGFKWTRVGYIHLATQQVGRTRPRHSDSTRKTVREAGSVCQTVVVRRRV